MGALPPIRRARPSNTRVESLVDGIPTRAPPGPTLKRGELAQYLVMGASVRQSLPFNGRSSFSDVNTADPEYAFAEAVV